MYAFVFIREMYAFTNYRGGNLPTVVQLGQRTNSITPSSETSELIGWVSGEATARQWEHK